MEQKRPRFLRAGKNVAPHFSQFRAIISSGIEAGSFGVAGGGVPSTLAQLLSVLILSHIRA